MGRHIDIAMDRNIIDRRLWIFDNKGARKIKNSYRNLQRMIEWAVIIQNGRAGIIII